MFRGVLNKPLLHNILNLSEKEIELEQGSSVRSQSESVQLRIGVTHLLK